LNKFFNFENAEIDCGICGWEQHAAASIYLKMGISDGGIFMARNPARLDHRRGVHLLGPKIRRALKRPPADRKAGGNLSDLTGPADHVCSQGQSGSGTAGRQGSF
jgi:hypothetical protein